MKAAVFLGTGRIEVQELALAALGPTDVRVRNRAVGVCGTDIHIFNGEKGSADVTPPVVLGHEFAGEVVEIGSAVTTVRVGDRVAIDPNIYCGKCHYCKIGKKQHCENLQAIGVTRHGGFAEYCVVPEQQVYVLGEDVDFEEGAMAEPLACCLHGIDLVGIRTGDTVCVIGGGPIGQIMVQLARISGASLVLLSEPVAERRRIALELGADYTFDPLAVPLVDSIREELGLPGVDVVIECAGVRSAVEQAFAVAKRGASILLFSVPAPDATYPLRLFDVFQKELKIQGSFINPDTHQRAVELLNAKKVQIAPLITHRYGLDGVAEAIQKQTEADSLKVLVKP